MTPTELRAAIEAILFVSGEPVRLDELTAAFPGENEESIRQVLEEIGRRLMESESGFTLEKTAGGYRFASRPELDPVLRKFFSRQGEGRLSVAALETLAIVAYRQPITAPEISELRSVNSSAVLRTLLERKLVRIAGRKNVVGSPFLYRTTREFLVHFGLDSIQDLPRLEEFAEILGENITEDLLAANPLPDGSEDSGSEISDEVTGMEAEASEQEAAEVEAGQAPVTEYSEVP